MTSDKHFREAAEDDLQRYHDDGFLHIPSMLPPELLEPLRAQMTDQAGEDSVFTKIGPLDYLGFVDPGDDLLGMLCRHEALLRWVRLLIAEPCYHYHTKVVRKPPGRAEALEWHQDYASWYKDGCIAPSMLTAVIALTRADARNGCLRLLRGSHQLGRLDRLSAGHESYSYFNLHPLRLAAVIERFEEVWVEMSIGDVLFFHANTLHASGPNQTDGPRILFESSYNARSNEPVFESQDYHRADEHRAVGEDELGRAVVPMGRTALIAIDDPNEPAAAIFRRRYDPGLC